MTPFASSQRDAALETIAVFLRSSGLSAAANAVEAVCQPTQGTTTVDDANKFVADLRVLIASLIGISVGGSNGSEGRALQSVQPDLWGGCPARAIAGPRADFGACGASPLGNILKRPNSTSEEQPRPAFHGLVSRPSLQEAQAQTLPSARYRLQRCADRPDSLLNFDPRIPEQYRDDNDPGYRVQEMPEAELSLPSSLAAAGPVLQPPQLELQDAGQGHTQGPGAVAVDDDELFSVGEGPAPLGEPITPRPHSFSGMVKGAGNAVLTALGVGGTSDPFSIRMNSTGFAMRRRGGAGSMGAPHGPISLADAVSHARPRGNQVAEGGALSSLVGDEGPSPAFGGSAEDVPTFGTPEVAASPSLPVAQARRPSWRYPESGDPFYPVEMGNNIYDSFSLRVVYERGRTGLEDSKDFPIQIDSVIAARFRVLEYLGSASFCHAVKCLDLQTNRLVCMKITKNDKDILDQSLDEIKLLRIINANATNIDDKCCLRLIDYFYFKEHLIIVTELLRENLYEFSKFNRERGEQPYFTLGRLQQLARQLLIALEYLHSLSLIHTDIKPENILLKSHSKCEVKVIDFGSACFLGDYMTSYVQSRSYRAPEVVLGLDYDQKIDIWSLGCVIAELWTGHMLFQNNSIQSLLARMISIVGHFPAHMLAAGKVVSKYFTQDGRLYQRAELGDEAETFSVPRQRHVVLYLPKTSSLRQRMRTDDERFLDFLSCLLRLDPTERPTASQALRHHWLAPGLYPDGI